jgi:hypothetical protein
VALGTGDGRRGEVGLAPNRKESRVEGETRGHRAVEALENIAVDDSAAFGGDVTFLFAPQLQFAAQGQFGDAVADDDGVARVSSDQSIVQNQINAGLGDVDDVNQGGGDAGDFFLFD